MKFYPARNESRRLLFQVSIPNGMEFYRSLSAAKEALNKFQFPTGWNSTESAKRVLVFGKVSIPNGMEFYAKSTTAA